jgi:hypothetical protein
MTNEEKRIKIAETLGWKEIPWQDLTNPREAREQKLFCKNNARHHCGWMPYYFNDLNACHEMEKFLGPIDGDAFSDYHHILRSMTGSTLGVTHASAAERAEAFGRTLSLWKEGE